MFVVVYGYKFTHDKFLELCEGMYEDPDKLHLIEDVEYTFEKNGVEVDIIFFELSYVIVGKKLKEIDNKILKIDQVEGVIQSEGDIREVEKIWDYFDEMDNEPEVYLIQIH